MTTNPGVLDELLDVRQRIRNEGKFGGRHLECGSCVPAVAATRFFIRGAAQGVTAKPPGMPSAIFTVCAGRPLTDVSAIPQPFFRCTRRLVLNCGWTSELMARVEPHSREVRRAASGLRSEIRGAGAARLGFPSRSWGHPQSDSAATGRIKETTARSLSGLPEKFASHVSLDAVTAGCAARIKNPGLSTIPRISDDHRYLCAAASRTILRTEGWS